MNIFNSLGSNYDLKFAVNVLFSRSISDEVKNLKLYLEDKYKGEAALLYKGREAIELALKLARLSEGSSVAINGFTCYVVYKAIKNAGLNVEYLDISKKNLNFSADVLNKAIKKNSKIKAVIVQNTLGYICDIESIQKVCKENNIILIEDLAHSIGSKYENGVEAGLMGDFTALSFSQDKMIDGISGGALIIRTKIQENNGTRIQGYRDIEIRRGSIRKEMIDKFYPFLTFLVRSTYKLQLGKILHAFFKKAHFLSLPIDKENKIYGFPGWNARLIHTQFMKLDMNLKHRNKIASVYSQRLDPKILLYSTKDQIDKSSNLRFPIMVKDREKLIFFLKNFGLHVSDIWYDAPIAPKTFFKFTDYNNECPEAQKMSDMILNLPTHKNVSEEDALKITDKINLWLKLQ